MPRSPGGSESWAGGRDVVQGSGNEQTRRVGEMGERATKTSDLGRAVEGGTSEDQIPCPNSV